VTADHSTGIASIPIRFNIRTPLRQFFSSSNRSLAPAVSLQPAFRQVWFDGAAQLATGSGDRVAACQRIVATRPAFSAPRGTAVRLSRSGRREACGVST